MVSQAARGDNTRTVDLLSLERAFRFSGGITRGAERLTFAHKECGQWESNLEGISDCHDDGKNTKITKRFIGIFEGCTLTDIVK